MQRFITRTSPLLLGIILSAPLLAGATWTAAPASPPSSNVEAPINVSGNSQTKTGNLVVSGLGSDSLHVQNGGSAIVDGKIGVGMAASHKLDVAGDIGGWAFFYTSDERLKTNIAPLSDALSKILRLNGVSFNWKASGEPSVGVIAQNVEQVYPELVATDPKTGLKSVQEGNLVAPLIEAVKAQQKEIDELKAEIAALKK